MRTMSWPPRLNSGTVEWVSGPLATAIVIMTTLSDLSQNPFNDQSSFTGNLVFKTDTSTEAKIRNALSRLDRLISVEAISSTVDDEGVVRYTIRFTDRETRTPGEVIVG